MLRKIRSLFVRRDRFGRAGKAATVQFIVDSADFVSNPTTGCCYDLTHPPTLRLRKGRLQLSPATPPAELTRQPCDVLVAGGGIVGSGVARDATTRGITSWTINRLVVNLREMPIKAVYCGDLF